MAPKSREEWDRQCELVLSQLAKADLGQSDADLEQVRVHFLGRSGALTELLKTLKDLTLEDRRERGPAVQQAKADFEARVAQRRAQLEEVADIEGFRKDALDLTLPALNPAGGSLHPLTTTLHEIARIFMAMGYSWAEGPHVETDRNNFTALNIPEDHPARDSHDTFYLKDLPQLLRTHTSTVQIRTMESTRPPLRIVCPGRVFRHEQIDATHSAVFHQVEGLVVDEGVGMSDLKGHLQTFLQRLLGPATKTRFRPSYFPFTEPSTEVDVKCFFCPGTGCPACKRTGWIEILGAGVVHPAVFGAVGYDARKWSGFAFGIGVERVAMLLHGVSDLRDFYTNDLRFLKQFHEDIV